MRGRHARARSIEDHDLPHEPSPALLIGAAILMTLLVGAAALLGA